MLNSSWFMKYNPSSFDHYIFENEDYKILINKWLTNKFIDGNLLLYGNAGVGKTTLSELLVKNLTKTHHDLKVIKSRSVSQIDELYSWCQSSPIGIKKIVYIEEFDKLSHVAFTTLKDSILEKFQEHVKFICNTNFINKLDPAIVSRFNYRFNLKGNPVGITDRLKYILVEEKISFDESILSKFVSNNWFKGLRNLITTIQMSSIDGSLNLKDRVIDTLENDIIENTLNIYSKILKLNKQDIKKIILIDPLNSIICDDYRKLIDLIQYNVDINYDIVFLHLEQQVNFLPIKILIGKYIESINDKKMPHIHFLSFIYESMKSVMDIQI